MKTDSMIPSVRGKEEETPGSYILTGEIGLDFGNFESWCADVFYERLARAGAISGGKSHTEAYCGGDAPAEAFSERKECPDVSGNRTVSDAGNRAAIVLVRSANLPEEGYELEITEGGICIQASTERGIVWALTTLAQLIAEGRQTVHMPDKAEQRQEVRVSEEAEKNEIAEKPDNTAAVTRNEIPCGRISDSPKYHHRGLSLDCARHFFSTEEVKKIIEEISLAKMNVLHWHLTDDQGWRIESKKFPKLHENSVDYYTQEEILNICEYARLRGVEIIPEIDMPGHVSALLNAYPEYSCSGRQVRIAKAGGIYPVILCAGKENTFAFLEELLEEILPLFPGRRVHLGGDEAPKGEWKKCPHCQAKFKELGLAEWEDMQGYFMTRAVDILKKYGKTAVCWNETLRASNYPKDIQVQYWTLGHRDSMEPFAAAGGSWIYSDMFELYLDYPYSMTPIKKLYGTVPHLGSTDVSDRKNLLGLECCLWSEHISETEKLEKMLFPRTGVVAEIAWSGVREDKEKEYAEFEIRFREWLRSTLHPELSLTPEEWWNPEGQERQREAFAYMASIHSGMTEEEQSQTVESSAPNEEFGRAFMTKFFRPEDLPILTGGKV